MHLITFEHAVVQQHINTQHEYSWLAYGMTTRATDLFYIELIRLLIVACGMLVHSGSCWLCEVVQVEHAVAQVDPEQPDQT